MTAALIIAAGKTDHKEKFSPEKQFGRLSAIERIVTLFKMSGIERVVVVEDESELPQKLLPPMNLVFLTAAADGEMLDSIRTGLAYLSDKCEAVLIAHVDVPMFSLRTVRALQDGIQDVCIPTCGGHCGHPILLRAQSFNHVLSYHGDGGLKGAIQAAGLRRQFIKTEDAGILPDGAYGTDYDDLLPSHDAAHLRATFQFRISKEQIFYGSGMHHLLQLTEEFGSLSNACHHMGISYTKGRKIIATMEEQLGAPVLQTQQGGKRGGFSRLTAEAKDMMRRYSAFRAEAEDALQTIFQKHFHDFEKAD